MPAPRARGRVGRPPGVDGDQTRQRILSAARSCFAANGYAATTNRMIADEAGLTMAAVYHHFGKKSELMVTVYRSTQALYEERIRRLVYAADGLIDQICALIDVIHETMLEDPVQVIFFSVARDEARRHPELAEIAEDRTFGDLFGELVRAGVASGEIDPADASAARGAVAAVATGLAMLARESTVEAHAVAVEGCKKLLAGVLFRHGAADQVIPAPT